MIIERLVWRAKFGHGDQVVEAFKRWRTQFAARFDLDARILVDVTGPMFTVVVETQYRDMAHVAATVEQLATLYGEREFQEWFASWQGAAEQGTRELYSVVA